MYLLFVVGSGVFCYTSRPRGPWFHNPSVCVSITTIHYNMKHEITPSNIHLLTSIRCYLLLLEVISIIDHFKLGLPFYVSDEGEWGLEKAPLFKVGNDRKSLRTTALAALFHPLHQQ